jgi:tetratricopeptide (TPR) repeat protein
LAQINEKLGESADVGGPKDYVAYRGQGDYDLSKKLFDKAIGDYSEAIRLNPKDARSFYGRAYAHGLKHDFKQTLEDCTRALNIDSRNVDAYKMRASANWKEGNFTKALSDLDKAITLAPSDPAPYEMRGDMYERREEFEKAAKDYQEVARLRPKDADSQRNYAWVLVRSDDKSIQNSVAAMEAAKAACELSSWTNSLNMEILAAACAKAGEYDRAIDYQKQALNVEDLKEEERERMLKTLWGYDDDRLWRDSTNRPPIKSEATIPAE